MKKSLSASFFLMLTCYIPCCVILCDFVFNQFNHAKEYNMKKMMVWMAAILVAAWAMADVKLDPVFTSNMMLQQGAPIAFFGTAPLKK